MNFAQQIAFVLAELIPGDADTKASIAAKLAPRVAAAIEQAGRTGCAMGRGSEKQGQSLDISLIVAVAQARGEALGVLRGAA
jgi:hypothetical protein